MNANQVKALEAAGHDLFSRGTDPGPYLRSLANGMGAAAVRIVEDAMDMLQAGLDDMVTRAELASEARELRYWEER